MKLCHDDEIERITEIERISSGQPTHLEMDAAFCARMRAAIAAGLENAPTRVATLRTKRSKYEQRTEATALAN
jgi:hypothetical protein